MKYPRRRPEDSNAVLSRHWLEIQSWISALGIVTDGHRSERFCKGDVGKVGEYGSNLGSWNKSGLV